MPFTREQSSESVCPEATQISMGPLNAAQAALDPGLARKGQAPGCEARVAASLEALTTSLPTLTMEGETC